MWTLESWTFTRCWFRCVLISVEVHLAIRLKKKIDWDITELIIELDSDVHSWEDEGISSQSDSDTGDTADTNFAWWTDNTNYRPSVPIIYKFTGGYSGVWQIEAPNIITSHWAFACCLFVLKLYNCWWKWQILLSVLDTVDEGHYTLPEVTVQEMYVFLAAVVQMGYVLRTHWWITGQH